MINLPFLLLIYIEMLIVVYWHELGHFGKQIVIHKIFPVPEGYSEAAGWQLRKWPVLDVFMGQFGGLTFNAIAFLAVWYFKPESIYLQLFGFLNWLHFSWYLIAGSFNYEPKIPKSQMKYWVFDDVPNELAIILVPLGIATLFFFYKFYIPILFNIGGAII